MSWITVIWSMIAAVCLTLGAIYVLVWYRNRANWASLLFAATAASTAVFTFCELWLMRVETPPQFLTAMKWGHVALLVWMVSIVWFVRFYLGTGRRWLAWTVCILRALYLLPTFLFGASVNYREITSLRPVMFLGEPVTIFKGIPNPWMLLGYATMVFILGFVADASITAWRRGDRRKALTAGGSIVFFLLLGNVETALIYWKSLPIPIILSPLYLGLVAVMGYELSRDVFRASQLVRELQASEAGLRESEARMSLAVEAADFGLWVRQVAGNVLWASEKCRELYGFAPSEPLDYDTIVSRIHPDDRGDLDRAMAMAVSGERDGKYQSEYRLMMADGSTRWMSSQGRVEYDAAGVPVLIRGAARDVTARKNAEAVVRNLSGRLLSAQEEERRRIASELHDNLSQQLALLSIEIETVAMTPADQIALPESMRQLGTRTAEIATEVHQLSHRLHSTKLETLGLQAAVRGHCRELRTQGLQVQCLTENVPGGLAHDVALCVFRVVQEGLNNVVKHSGASEARVTLAGTEDGLVLTITDSGRGFAETAARELAGVGLASMRERVLLAGGTFTLSSEPGLGVTIVVRVPIIGMDESAAGPRRPWAGYAAAAVAAPARPRSVADGDSPNTAL